MVALIYIFWEHYQTSALRHSTPYAGLRAVTPRVPPCTRGLQLSCPGVQGEGCQLAIQIKIFIVFSSSGRQVWLRHQTDVYREGDCGGQEQLHSEGGTGRLCVPLVSWPYCSDQWPPHAQGVIDETKEPFSIRKKEFWDVSETHKLMSPDFAVSEVWSKVRCVHDADIPKKILCWNAPWTRPCKSIPANTRRKINYGC